MKFELSKAKADQIKAGLLVLGQDGSKLKRHSTLDRLDQQLGGALARLLKEEHFEGKKDQCKLIRSFGQLPQEAILLVGTQVERDGDLPLGPLEVLRQGVGRAIRTARQLHASRVVIDLGEWPTHLPSESEAVQAASEGALMGAYRFTRYKKDKAANGANVEQVQLACARLTKAHQQALAVGAAGGLGTCLARDLVNTPANDMTPAALAKAAQKLPSAIHVRVYEKNEITDMGMNAFLAVNSGSEAAPKLIHMHYRPRKKSRATIALIGKGVTFDSGGLSLKPPPSMETMKDDMAGAATVIGVMQAVAELKPDLTIHAVIAATENMPSGSADRPGDIVTAMNGKTIEILNTDAEGRLTLADALGFALKKRPDVMIDLATLTGACLVALGDQCTGLMSNNPQLSKALRNASAQVGERIWPLPLIADYAKEIESPIADLKNIGGRWGGTIEAGLFLKEFVEKTPWAHLDIAGPSWADKDRPYEPRGGTGCLVRTLLHYLLHYSA